MEVPFSGFELAFIVVAFVVFSLFSIASVCIRPDEGLRFFDLKKKKKKKTRNQDKSFEGFLRGN
uniref:Transmembrane protein n=1 Tax=Hippocampus comes TaxID=109280 RepID=A0A3Q2XJT6_HIPCM